MSDEAPRCAGVVFRSYLKVLQTRDLTAAVRAAVASDEARALMDAPPAANAWVPLTMLAAILEALGRTSGRETIRQVAHEAAKATTGPLLMPLLKTLQTLTGGSPADIYRRLNTLIGVQVKGVSFDFQDTSPTSGEITPRSTAPVSDFMMAAWEGMLLFSTSNRPREVQRSRIAPDALSAKIAISW